VFADQQQVLRREEGLFALADQLEVRLAGARGKVDWLVVEAICGIKETSRDG